MATENAPLQVLVSSGNQAVLAAGSRPDALANGQIGIFNYHTGLSVDGSVPQDTKDIYIAVGINRTTGGTDAAEDIKRSIGQMIQTTRVDGYTIKGASDEVPKVIDISNYVTFCGTTYVLNFEFRNRKNYGQNGYNSLRKPFSYTTSDCPANLCDDCAQIGEPTELASALVNLMNADTDKIITASLRVNQSGVTVAGASGNGTLVIAIGTETFNVPVLSGDSATVVAAKIAAVIAATSTSKYYATSAVAVLSALVKIAGTVPTITLTSAGGSGVTFTSPTNTTTTISNIANFKAANPGVAPIIRVSGNVEKRPLANGNINTKYYKSGVDFDITGRSAFMSNSTMTVATDLRYSENSGYDLQQLEYMSYGFNHTPYRQFEDGLQKNNFEYFTSPTAKYAVVDLKYHVQSVAGWKLENNHVELVLAIPCADSTTLSGLVTVFDLIFTQFGAMTNDISGMGCTSAKAGTFTPATDGIEILG